LQRVHSIHPPYGGTSTLGRYRCLPDPLARFALPCLTSPFPPPHSNQVPHPSVPTTSYRSSPQSKNCQPLLASPPRSGKFSPACLSPPSIPSPDILEPRHRRHTLPDITTRTHLLLGSRVLRISSSPACSKPIGAIADATFRTSPPPPLLPAVIGCLVVTIATTP
jgi:hypothetical protein